MVSSQRIWKDSLARNLVLQYTHKCPLLAYCLVIACQLDAQWVALPHVGFWIEMNV